MSHYLADDDKFRDLLYGDDYRAYLMARSKSAADCRFGRTPGKRARGALRHVTGYFRTTIEAIANSKLRRMERELELRGIYRDPAEDSWMRKSQSTERS